MADLRSQRQVTRDEGAELAARWRVPFVECSAKENLRVADVAGRAGTLGTEGRGRRGDPADPRRRRDARVAAQVFTVLLKEIERDSGFLDPEPVRGCALL